MTQIISLQFKYSSAESCSVSTIIFSPKSEKKASKKKAKHYHYVAYICPSTFSFNNPRQHKSCMNEHW